MLDARLVSTLVFISVDIIRRTLVLDVLHYASGILNNDNITKDGSKIGRFVAENSNI